MQGLPLYWRDLEKPYSIDWERWLCLFSVALMAGYSINIDEVERTPDEDNLRVKALMGDLPEISANRKVISLLFLSLGEMG